MGQEINASRFKGSDFRAFSERLREETELLSRWFRERRFDAVGATGGVELEAWLVDRAMRPAPINEIYLKTLNNPLVVPELARFNVELNSSPQRLEGAALSRMRRELEATLDHCNRVAGAMDARLMTVGILPTVRDEDLCLENMSALQRYRALNEQVLRLREGRPLVLDISGREHLRMEHHSVMQEAAATSLQIHLQVSQDHAVRYYNAAKVLAAPMVAVCANAPYLYGHDLWDDTRIPLFEQAVATSSSGHKTAERVTFGHGYARESLMECFQDNLENFDILLPEVFDSPVENLAHLRLHNGTIWRWNRPLIGLGGDGAPHLRIEHRVASAPTSILDTLANVALFFGLVHDLAMRQTPPETQLSFAEARRNFYRSAERGLDAEIVWLQGRRVNVGELVCDRLLDRAAEGLRDLGLDGSDSGYYLGIIRERLKTGQNGAAWHRAFVGAHGRDMQALTAAYVDRQTGGEPVHQWPL